MQPPPRLDLGNPPQPHPQQSSVPPHFPPPPYREEQPAPKAKSGLGKLLPTIITLGAFGGLAVLAWFAYQEGKNPVSDDDVPVIKADQEPFKHAPENPGGEEIPHADKEVYNSFTSDKSAAAADTAKKAQALPDSERPIDHSFLKQFAGTGDDEGGSAKQEAIAFGDNKDNKKPADTAKVPAAAAAAKTGDAPLEAKPLPLAKPNETLPTPNTGGVEVVKKMQLVQEEKPAAAQKPIIEDDDAPAKAAVSEDAAPTVPSADLKKSEKVKKAAVAKPKAAKKEKAPAKKEKATAKKEKTTTKTAKASAGTTHAQLGAYKSEAEAKHEWKRIMGKHKSLLAGLSMNVQKAEIPGKGTMYRLQVSEKSKDAAKTLCKKLSAAGQGCFIAK